jgi:hypothetical protein
LPPPLLTRSPKTSWTFCSLMPFLFRC